MWDFIILGIAAFLIFLYRYGAEGEIWHLPIVF